MAHLLFTFFLWFIIVLSNPSPITQQQRNALLDIYNSLDGPSWSCSWNITQLMNGYVVDNCHDGYDRPDNIARVRNESVIINDTTHNIPVVYKLTFDLISDTVSGTLPPSISSLSTLTNLEITGYGISGTLPNNICNLTHLKYLSISNANITGTIPSCLFENNPNLTSIYIQNTSFYDIIPESIGSLTKLQHLTLKANKQMIQPIPNITNLNNLYFVSFQGYFTGTISDFFCNLPELKDIQLISMPYLSGSIPECIFDNPNLWEISIISTNIEGTIPDALCSASLNTISLQNNPKLTGSLPKCQHNNWTGLQYVIITQNQGLSGSIPSPYLCTPSLNFIHISDNINMERTIVPTCWSNMSNDNTYFRDSKVINMPNSKLYGTLPAMNWTNLKALILHNNEIYGSIPSTFYGHNSFLLEVITLYNNRLSCSIPDSSLFETCTEYVGGFNCSALVLSQNLFECEDDNQFDSYFSSAVNLFVTASDKTKSWILLIVSSLCLVYYIIKSYLKKQNKVFVYKAGQFVEDIELFQSKFGDWKLLSLIMLLLIVYPLCSNYYQCSPIHTWFSLAWFDNEDTNTWINWLLMIIWVAINGLFCHIVASLYAIQLESKGKAMRMNANNESLLDQYDFIDDASSIHIEYNVKMKINIFIKLFTFIIYFVLYLLGITMIILYLFCESLPDDNTLIPSSSTREFVTKTMAFVLVINNSVIVPGLVKSFGSLISADCITDKTMEIITILRTIHYLIIPIIASILLLNDCGRWWTKYWIPCNAENKDQFNIRDLDLSWLYGKPVKHYFLTSDDVCKPNNFTNIYWSKCIRSFFYQWTYVIMTKFIIMIFVPLLVMAYKWSKNEVIYRYRAYKGRNKNDKQDKIEIDSEYSSIITSFESVIAFSIISPLLIPIVLVAVDANIYCYNIMINKLKWKLTSYKDLYSSFPTQLLIIGILCGQLLTVSFFIFAIDNKILYGIYISSLCVSNCIYMWLCCKSKRFLS